MGQCCGMERRITMNEVTTDVNGEKQDNPYLESKKSNNDCSDDQTPLVQAKSIYDSDVGKNEEIKSLAL